jgi:hypothetical protein
VPDRVPNPSSLILGLKVAQIIVKARSSEDSQRNQLAELKLRDRAKQVGLARRDREGPHHSARPTTYGNLPTSSTMHRTSAIGHSVTSPAR